jgi:hypothetical protein
MGNAKSTNVANITTDIVSNEISNEMNSINLQSGQSEMISVVGGSGSVQIDGNIQKQSVSMNLDAIAKQMSTQKSQQSIVQKLSQAAAASVSGVSVFNNSETDNTLNDTLNASMNVASNLAQICAGSGVQSEIIQVDQRDGTIQINNNNQSQVASVLAKCLQSATANNTSLQQATQELSQTATSTVVGMSLMDLIILALVGIFAMMAPVLLPVIVGAGVAAKAFTAVMGVICVVGGIVCIVVLYPKYKGTTTTTMTGIQFSTLINNDPSCGSSPYNPVPALSPGAAAPPVKTSNQLENAAALCLSDPNCKGMDWDASKSPAVVTFYNKLGSNPCPNVKTQNLATAGIDLMGTPNFYSGTGPPTMATASAAANPPKSNVGDVYLDNASGRWYWNVLTDKTKSPWADISGKTSTMPAWKSGVTVTTGLQETQTDSVGKDGDLFIDMLDPNAWELWQRVSGKYVPLSTTDAGDMVVGPNGGTLLSVGYATENSMPFPGRHGTVKPAENYNWSGYVVEQDTSSQFWLFLGIFLIILGVGIIGVQIYLYFKNRNKGPAGPPGSAKPAGPAGPGGAIELQPVKK